MLGAGAGILGILTMLAAVGSIICAIIVIIKMFQTEGALKGILGLLCGLYAFIWGWMNAGKLNLRNIMLIWTVLIVLNILLGVSSGLMGASTLSQQPVAP